MIQTVRIVQHIVQQMCTSYESGQIRECVVGELYCKRFCYEEVWKLEALLSFECSTSWETGNQLHHSRISSWYSQERHDSCRITSAEYRVHFCESCCKSCLAPSWWTAVWGGYNGSELAGRHGQHALTCCLCDELLFAVGTISLSCSWPQTMYSKVVPSWWTATWGGYCSEFELAVGYRQCTPNLMCGWPCIVIQCG